MYRLRASGRRRRSARVRLLGSGAILREVHRGGRAAGASDWRVAAEVWSVTSFSELAREAREVERWNRLQPGATGAHAAIVGAAASRRRAPIVAATDYVRAVAELIRACLPSAARYVTLGTDGFGRSDTRAALRGFFEVDRRARSCWRRSPALAQHGAIAARHSADALLRYGIAVDGVAPWLG